MVEQIKFTIPQMLAKLDTMYNEENQLKTQMLQLQKRYKQLQDDKVLKILRQASGRMPAVVVFQRLLEITEDRKFLF